jgi:UDP-N-acetylmuramoyl-L-alanyl-D-glutamate--2,6-diaminopimelate ligase
VIIDQVVAGVAASDRSKVQPEVDRRAAIARALRVAEPHDIVVIAGKGHEATQTIGEEQRAFDDRVVARELLDELATIDVTGDAS